ncbi:hypothetical protein MHK_001948, partial [Candidatus Magnetomorum sp. HK-1]
MSEIIFENYLVYQGDVSFSTSRDGYRFYYPNNEKWLKKEEEIEILQYVKYLKTNVHYSNNLTGTIYQSFLITPVTNENCTIIICFLDYSIYRPMPRYLIVRYSNIKGSEACEDLYNNILFTTTVYNKLLNFEKIDYVANNILEKVTFDTNLQFKGLDILMKHKLKHINVPLQNTSLFENLLKCFNYAPLSILMKIFISHNLKDWPVKKKDAIILFGEKPKNLHFYDFNDYSPGLIYNLSIALLDSKKLNSEKVSIIIYNIFNKKNRKERKKKIETLKKYVEPSI